MWVNYFAIMLSPSKGMFAGNALESNALPKDGLGKKSPILGNRIDSGGLGQGTGSLLQFLITWLSTGYLP
jgi:hypothetical protein